MILRVIMSSSRSRAEAKTYFLFVQGKITQSLASVSVIYRIIKVSVRVISLSLWLRLLSPASTLIILDITKTSSNSWIQHPSLINERQKHKHLFDDGIVVYFKLVLLKQRT